MFTAEINHRTINRLFTYFSQSIVHWQIWRRNSDGSADCVRVVMGEEGFYNSALVITRLLTQATLPSSLFHEMLN